LVVRNKKWYRIIYSIVCAPIKRRVAIAQMGRGYDKRIKVDYASVSVSTLVKEPLLGS
jgi:hypothetical protein